MTVWRLRIACWITKATNTQSQYILRFAFSTATMVARRTSTVGYTRIVTDLQNISELLLLFSQITF